MGFKGGSGNLTDLEVDSGTLSVDAANNRIGIGLTDPKTKLTVEGAVTLKEQANADGDTAAYGQLWVKSNSPNDLYFTNDDGDDVRITNGNSIAAASGGAVAADDINVGDSNISIAGGSGHSITLNATAAQAQLKTTTSGQVDITSAADIDINATTGIAIDATTVSIDGTDDSNLTVTASGKDLDIAVAGGSTQELRLASAGTGASALHLNASAGSVDIDSADAITVDAADEIVITTTSADGHISLVSAHTAGVAVHIDADANAGSIVDIDAGILDIDVTAGTTLNTTGLTITDTTTSSATEGGSIRLVSDDGAVMADNHRLGVIEFAGAEDTSNTISVGARIQAICRDAWDGSNNDADLEFYTTNGTTESLVLTLDADKLATFTGNVTIDSDTAATNLQITNSATDGDAAIQFALGGTVKYTMGVNDGASDAFEINVGTGALGSGGGGGNVTALKIDTSGNVTLNNLTFDSFADDLAFGTSGANLLEYNKWSASANQGMTIFNSHASGPITLQAGDDSNVRIFSDKASAADTGAVFRLFTDDGAAMGDGHRLGVIEFAGAEDASDTITVGARIESLCDAAWSGTENGASLVFYTTDADASQSQVLKLDSNKLATFAGSIWQNTDGAKLLFGADGEVTLSHVHDTGLLLSDASGIGTTKLMFGDSACFIQQQADGELGIDADSIINVTAPTVDIDASTAVTIDGPAVTVADSADGKPVLTIKTTHTTKTSSGELQFLKDAADTEDGEVLGQITFYGEDEGNNNTAFAKIVASISESDEGDEAGKLEFFVAESDSTTTALTAGLTLEGEHATDGEIDVTIGAGTGSTTTIAGTLDLGDRNITNVGDISLDSVSSDGSLVTINAPCEIANGSSTGAAALVLDNDDTDQIALVVEAANIDADVIDITADAVTTANVIDITADALTSGAALKIVSDCASTTVRSLAHIHQDHASATHAACLRLTQDGAGPALQIEGSTIHAANNTMSNNTAGQTITAAQLIDGFFTAMNRNSSQTDTTATAAQVVAAIPNCSTDTLITFRYINVSSNAVTLAPGSGFTDMGGGTSGFSIGAQQGRVFAFSFSDVSSSSEAGKIVPLSAAYNLNS